jgi:competence protein ComEC
MSISFFALGIWFFQTLRAIPSDGVLLVLGLALTACVGLVFYRRSSSSAMKGFVLLAVIAMVTGFMWAALRADIRLADALPAASEGRDVLVTGVVAELPAPSERGVRFAFEVEAASAEVPRRIYLSWSRGRNDDSTYSVVRPGERWQFMVRLKRPHGAANPNGFDYEAWLLERDLRATGHVRAGASNKRLETFVPSFMGAVHRARDSVRKRFQAQLPNSEYLGVLIALAVGDQRAIPQW